MFWSTLLDLGALQTVGDVLDEITNAHADLTATIGATGQITVADASGGTGNLKIESYNGTNTAEDLGIAGDVSDTSIVGSALSLGSVILDGRGENDTLTGTGGNDWFIGGTGADSVHRRWRDGHNCRGPFGILNRHHDDADQ